MFVKWVLLDSCSDQNRIFRLFILFAYTDEPVIFFQADYLNFSRLQSDVGFMTFYSYKDWVNNFEVMAGEKTLKLWKNITK